jgi:hypothetical protein
MVSRLWHSSHSFFDVCTCAKAFTLSSQNSHSNIGSITKLVKSERYLRQELLAMGIHWGICERD